MDIAVLGTGTVGRAIAGRLSELGHSVTIGTRDPDATRAKEEYAAWAGPSPPSPSPRSPTLPPVRSWS